jgi:hypothetical protein
MAAATPDTDQYAGAIVAPAFAFGLNTSTPAGAVHHLDGQRLLWPAGRFFATLSAEDGKVRGVAGGAARMVATHTASWRQLLLLPSHHTRRRRSSPWPPARAA